MADRYWVGGTSTWDATAGTKWATVSGGVGGAAVPTSADNVFFNGASGVSTVTVSATATCANLDFSGFNGTFAGSSAINIYGSLTASSVMTWTNTSTLSFLGAGSWTLTSASRTLGPIVINNTSAIVTLGGALTLTTTGSITLTAGTFTTNNFNVSCGSFSSSNSNTRAVNLGSSTMTLSQTAGLTFATSTGLTLNAGTSTIVLSATSAVTFDGGGKTFYNLSYTGTVANVNHTISSSNTFNNLSVTAPSVPGTISILFAANQVFNGGLITTGTTGSQRVWFKSSVNFMARSLTVSGSSTLTDADFQDLYVSGSGAPLTGTRIGNKGGGCLGISFTDPKTVYWVTAMPSSWGANNFSNTSGGAPNIIYYPLPQDTVIIDNTAPIAGQQIPLGSLTNINAIGTIDMSARTTAVTIAASYASFYGHIITGSGVTYSGTNAITFSGRCIQQVTSAGKSFGSLPITISSPGGAVLLQDAFTSTSSITVTNGTFSTNGYSLSASSLNVNTVGQVSLESSTVTLSSNNPFTIDLSYWAVFDAGTSNITLTGSAIALTQIATYYNVVVPSTGTTVGYGTFNNLTVTAPSSGIYSELAVSANFTVLGTLTCAGSTAINRMFLRSSTYGTSMTITANALSATDCDFLDITIAGSASGSSPTRAGNCGNNSGITFPVAKTVYWNLTGTQNWNATAWATSSGGVPAVNNYPLPQDTAVFDNTGAATDVVINDKYLIGSINMASKTTAMNFSVTTAGSTYARIFGNFTLGSGVTTVSGTIPVDFYSQSTQTLNCNGVTFNFPLRANGSGTVQLSAAFSMGSTTTLTLLNGTFNASSYNVTLGVFNSSTTTYVRALRMGSGLWTVSGTGTCWNVSDTNLTVYPGSANILLSDNSTTSRTFIGASSGSPKSYNKLTIGGTSSTSTTNISGGTYSELASTKTVAHSVGFSGSSVNYIATWSISGTAGNLVTVFNNATTLTPSNGYWSGVDYLTLGTTNPSAKFYAGANSTGTGANVVLSATPAPRTLYWVGGTGNFSDTAHWSTSSGGAGGAAVPTAFDSVIFNSASSATGYTVTLNAFGCGSVNFGAPASGTLSIAGSSPVTSYGDITFAAAGVTNGLTGSWTCAGPSARTITTNGVSINTFIFNANNTTITLGSALTITSSLNIWGGTLNTAGFALSTSFISTNPSFSPQNLSFGSSTISLSSSSSPINFLNTLNPYLTVSAGTSTINFTATSSIGQINFGDNALNNISFTSSLMPSVGFSNGSTFNNVSFVASSTASYRIIYLYGDITVTGTFTVTAPASLYLRTSILSDKATTTGTLRTLTANAISLSNAAVDFGYIKLAGAAAGSSIAGAGNLGGNSGITFPAPKTVYWNLAGTNQWQSNGWASTSGGAPALSNFPLAQDTAVFDNAGAATSITAPLASVTTGKIDASARTLALTWDPTGLEIYGGVTLGSGVTVSGTSIGFYGPAAQTFTTAGVPITGFVRVSCLNGSLTLVGNLTASAYLYITSGTFNASTYNVSVTYVDATGTNSKTINMGSGTWTLSDIGTVWNTNAATTSISSGTSNIVLSNTTTSARTFAGGGFSYGKLTIGGTTGTSTLTITGNNSFTEIASTKTVAHTISLGATSQKVGAWTATGSAGNLISITGSPAYLTYTGSSNVSVDYLSLSLIAGLPYVGKWFAGANSTNLGSNGFSFRAAPAASGSSNFFLMFN